MFQTAPFRTAALCGALSALLALGACGKALLTRTMTAHECMTRVMYFESNRTSAEGMIAVGTVVMNRVESPKYPNSVCAVVAQKNQFAPGVLTKPMEEGRELAAKMASRVLAGSRHRKVGRAQFFHTAGMTFPYTNMHYLVVAGGNVFYEKRKNARRLSDPPFRNPEPAGYAPQGAKRFGGAPTPTLRRETASMRSPVSLPPMSIDDLIAANGG